MPPLYPNATVLCDIDGTLCRYLPATYTGQEDMQLLPGTLEKLVEWRAKGYLIILTTGRGGPESVANREMTEGQLKRAGIVYDHLIMGIGGGKRILINDTKPDGRLTAVAYSLPRNAGISSINE